MKTIYRLQSALCIMAILLIGISVFSPYMGAAQSKQPESGIAGRVFHIVTLANSDAIITDRVRHLGRSAGTA